MDDNLPKSINTKKMSTTQVMMLRDKAQVMLKHNNSFIEYDVERFGI